MPSNTTTNPSAKSTESASQPTTATTASKEPSEVKGTNSAAKHAGFKNFPAFLESYNLKIHNAEDVKEGRAILRAMGYGVSG